VSVNVMVRDTRPNSTMIANANGKKALGAVSPIWRVLQHLAAERHLALRHCEHAHTSPHPFSSLRRPPY
jgi:hypothetical protein